MIKKFLTASLILLSAGLNLFALEKISGSSLSVCAVGRYLDAPDGTRSFDWSGTTLMLSFTGKTLSLRCSDTGRDCFNLWLDKERTAYPDRVVEFKGDTVIVLFSAKKKGTHTLIFQKRTEGEQGKVTLHSFETDGHFEKAPQPRPRLIEFIGDSYTCGYGTEAPNRDEPFKAETENPSLTYADILGRFFDAEAIHISHSGRGVVRNYGGFQSETMPELYKRTFDGTAEPLWEKGYTPDVVVIYLGTNDFSEGIHPALSWWCDGYATLLAQVRSNYGEKVPIVCVASPCDERMDDYVEEAVRRSGVENTVYVAIDPLCYNYDSDLGASWHPNYSGQRKVASVIAPYIATVTGWELPVKALE